MTPDTPAPDPTAVMVRRVIAHLLDAALYIGIALVPLALLTDSRTIAAGESLDRVGRFNGEDLYFFKGNTVYILTESDLITAGLITLGAYLLLAVVLQGLTGRTVGKFVTGIRAVRPDGRVPGIGRAFLRELAWIVDGIPTFAIALVGGIFALVTTGRRRIGDFLGRTYVVHRQFAGTPIIHPDDAAAEAEDVSDEAGDAAIVTAGAAAVDDAGAAEAPSEDEEDAAGAAVFAPSDDEPAEAAAVPDAAAAAPTEDEEAAGTTIFKTSADEPAEVEATDQDAPPGRVVDTRPSYDDEDESATSPDDSEQPEATDDDSEQPEATDDEPEQPEAADDESDAGDLGTPETSGDQPTEPRWDPDRRAYISYDPRRGGWVQHDTETGKWGPISRA